jgi:RNA polymerase sigma-70 factor (ECF subfamily)
MPADAPLDPALFRSAWSRIVGWLTRRYHLSDPARAEDAVQHAMLTATRQWPLAGVPTEPVAWLTTVARNHLLDQLRYDARWLPWADMPPDAEPNVEEVDTQAAGELGDDELALLFACCDPGLPLASQVALALKVVCGFSLREIAAGLLTDEAALAQRLARARRTLAARGTPIALPSGLELAERREAALHAIHLLFNEGYAASGGPVGQRPDLCLEAIRLARSVAAHPATAHADADALAAMLLLHGARLAGRIDAEGDWLLLVEQDRSGWDASMIAAGLAHLQRAQRAERLSAWHLRAGIAAEHSTSPEFAATRWDQILAHYEALERVDRGAPTRLARAIALGHAHGAAAGLTAVDALVDELPAGSRAYGLAARALWLAQLQRQDAAAEALHAAIECAPQEPARRLLRRRLEALLVAGSPEPAANRPASAAAG